MPFFERVYEKSESIFQLIVEYGVLIMEAIGVLIIFASVLRCAYFLLIRKHQRNLRLVLAHGITFALEFKLGGEVLRTILARSFTEMAMIACVIALRAALTFLLHWEVKEEHDIGEARSTITDHTQALPETAPEPAPKAKTHR